MKMVLVNGLNSNVGGGRSILNNIVRLSHKSNLDWYIAVSSKDVVEANNNDRIILFPRFFGMTIFSPLVSGLLLPLYIRFKNFHTVVNLGDIPVLTNAKQLMLFDWPYAMYPNSEAWNRLTWRESFVKKLKLRLFKYNLSFVDELFCQTQIAADRIHRIYGFTQTYILPNAVDLNNLGSVQPKTGELNGKFIVGCLSHYYSHKNLETLCEVFKEISDEEVPIRLKLTIDPLDGEGARKLINWIQSESISNIELVGRVRSEKVPDFYASIDAMILPSLLESFSGTYVEAMYHNLPILTSDLDFAREVCGKAALYFDPLNRDSMKEAIYLLHKDKKLRLSKVYAGKRRLQDFFGWPQVFNILKLRVREYANM